MAVSRTERKHLQKNEVFPLNDMVKNLFLWLLIAVVLISIFSNFGPRTGTEQKFTYSEFLHQVDTGNVNAVTIDNRNIEGMTQNEQPFSTYMPVEDTNLLTDLIKHNVNVKGKAPEQQSLLMHIFINWFPMLLLIGVWVFFMRQMQGGGGRGAFGEQALPASGD